MLMAQELELFIQSVPYNPVFDRGADTTYALCLRDMNQKEIDLSGYTARMTIYPYQRSSLKANPTVYDELTTENGRLYGRDEVTGEPGPLGKDGVIWVNFPAETTQGYKWTRGWYRLEIISVGGKIYRIADGEVMVRD